MSLGVLDRAWTIYNETRSQYRHHPPAYVQDDKALARPFGRPSDMPEHQWRLSPDVWESLVAATDSNGMYVVDMGDLGDMTTHRLFGFPIEVVDSTDLLELVPTQ